MQLLSPVFVLTTQVIDLALVVTYSHEQLRVGLLSREELVNYLLHIGKTSTRSNLLEGIFDFISAFHLTLHLFLQELRPHLLDHVVLLHLKLV